jgi:hypothetical protein
VTLPLPAKLSWADKASPPPTQDAARPKHYQRQKHRHATPSRTHIVNLRCANVNVLVPSGFRSRARATFTSNRPRHHFVNFPFTSREALNSFTLGPLRRYPRLQAARRFCASPPTNYSFFNEEFLL